MFDIRQDFVEICAEKNILGIIKGYYVAFEEEGMFIILIEKEGKEHEWIFADPYREWGSFDDSKNYYSWKIV